MEKYSVLFLLSMIKFLFAPFGGPAAGLTFFETYVSCVAGAVLSATMFYFMSEFFMNKAQAKRVAQIKKANEQGKALPFKKKFTKSKLIGP